MPLPIKLNEGEYSTSDLSLATYYCCRKDEDPELDLEFIRVINKPEQFGRAKRLKCFFIFKMDEVLAEKLGAEYANSKYPAFEGKRRALSKQKWIKEHP